MISKRNRGILVFFLFTLLTSQGTLSAQPGQLILNQDPRVDELVRRHIELNEKMLGIPGFRIQIFFASGNDSKDRANAVRTEALKSHNQQPVYILFEAPYYKVRMGDFRTRLDAERALQSIRLSFPGAFIVEDLIQNPALLPE
jgi:hypothetical protein